MKLTILISVLLLPVSLFGQSEDTLVQKSYLEDLQTVIYHVKTSEHNIKLNNYVVTHLKVTDTIFRHEDSVCIVFKSKSGIILKSERSYFFRNQWPNGPPYTKVDSSITYFDSLGRQIYGETWTTAIPVYDTFGNGAGGTAYSQIPTPYLHMQTRTEYDDCGEVMKSVFSMMGVINFTTRITNESNSGSIITPKYTSKEIPFYKFWE